MSRHPINSKGLKSLPFHDLGGSAPTIPIVFLPDSPSRLQVKIQPQMSMTPPDAHSEKPLIPALFQIAARADELQSLESLPALKNALAMDRAFRSEIMLDAEKLDAVLKAAAAKKKKSAPRRVSAAHLDKRPAHDHPTA
jgi:hypothetical protein